MTVLNADSDFLKSTYIANMIVKNNNAIAEFLAHDDNHKPDIVHAFNKQQAAYNYELVTIGHSLLEHNPKTANKSSDNILSSEFPLIALHHRNITKTKSDIASERSDIYGRESHADESILSGTALFIGGGLGLLAGHYVGLNPAFSIGAGWVAGSAAFYSLISATHAPHIKKSREKIAYLEEYLSNIKKDPDLYPVTLSALKALKNNKPDLLQDRAIQQQTQFVVANLAIKNNTPQ